MEAMEDKVVGSLIGLACGDAVGTTLEFEHPGSFEPITDMVGGGPFNLKAGQWTDDTSMALCLAESLLSKSGFDPADQMNRYCNWWERGYMSCTGDCFDIGNTVSGALGKYLDSNDPFSGATEEYSSGNGSLMRLSPVPMYYHHDYNSCIKYAGESSRTTHGSNECIDSCKYFSSLLYTAFRENEKEAILTDCKYHPETIKAKEIATGQYRSKPYSELCGSGYVIQSMEAALWCFFNTNSFEEAILAAANLGGDADTTAAICGQLAGAFYGLTGIPAAWKERLCMYSEIENIARNLYKFNCSKKLV